MESQPTEFAQLVLAAKVPQEIARDLEAQDFDVPSFAMLALSLETLDSALDELGMVSLSARSRAALRVLWTSCQRMVAEPSGPAPASTPTVPAAQSTWSDFFLPKLQPDVLRKLISEFESAYPIKILQPENMPGPRLLSLCHSQLSRQEWKWIPWKYRLSQKLHDDQSLSRPRKMLRSESFQDMLFDDVPTRDIPQHQIGMAHLQQLLRLHDFAIALRKGAHLGTLKMYSHKFCNLAGARFDPDSGLRAPSCPELVQADQSLWQKIGDLYHRGWTLDDAVHEICQVRSDMEALLQPRAAPAKAVSYPKGGGKSVSKSSSSGASPKGKGKSKGKPRNHWITETTKDGKKVILCLRFNMGQCSDPQCKFVHLCCINKNGAACGGAHPAYKHPEMA